MRLSILRPLLFEEKTKNNISILSGGWKSYSQADIISATKGISNEILWSGLE